MQQIQQYITCKCALYVILSLNNATNNHSNLPTHFLRKQDLYLFCVVGPGHLLPPHLGAGRVQVLCLMKSRRPLPHVFEHVPCALHCPQEPQLPLTVVFKNQ